MCDRCQTYFTIHTLTELNNYLKLYKYDKKVLDVWLERKYISNLLYLEWLHSKRVDKIKPVVKI